MTWQQWRTRALRLAGGATALAAALGVFCVRYAGLVHEWRLPNCGFPAGCDYMEPVWLPPTTSVTLPDGSAADFGVYAGLVIAISALVALAAVACAEERPRPAWRVGLWVVAALLVLCLVAFRLPPATRASTCFPPNSCATVVYPYPGAIPSVWYVVPAGALGLLAAGLGLLPARRRTQRTTRGAQGGASREAGGGADTTN